MYTYKTNGVCSKAIHVDLNGNRIDHVDFIGGCDGNLKAISKLVEGKSVDEVSGLLTGVTCGRKTTSCADQLVCALHEAQAHRAQ